MTSSIRLRHGSPLALLVLLAELLPTALAVAQPPERVTLHGQATLVHQYHPSFRSPHSGTNSLDAQSQGKETFDVTLYAGLRLWTGAELYANPEIDQGFGLSNTVGVAGFPSGEAYKVGKSSPYFRLQRLFIRQTLNFGGAAGEVAAGANQLRGKRNDRNLVLTAGKISPTDIFDVNTYAHDPKSDFLNWAVVDAGAYDYAADAWGYSYGLAAEWTQSWWTLRAGWFNLSRVPNSTELEHDFSQSEIVVEGEARHTWWGKRGKLKLLGFMNHGRMGRYDAAVDLARGTNAPPNAALVRRFASRPGLALNLEQDLGHSTGAFGRVSVNDGRMEAFEFTEINRSLAGGFSFTGAGWGRPHDGAGIAGVVNALSPPARRYFAAGGQGILIGDGQLPHYGTERIFEADYQFGLTEWLATAVDFQFIANPAYNRDRGPVSVIGLRLHIQF